MSAVKHACVYEADTVANCCFGCREKYKIVPLVLQTGHQQGEQVEGEEDTQTEQHAHHIHLRCGVWRQIDLL